MSSATQHMLGGLWGRGGVRDVYADFNELTLNITTNALFGVNMSSRQAAGISGMRFSLSCNLHCPVCLALAQGTMQLLLFNTRYALLTVDTSSRQAAATINMHLSLSGAYSNRLKCSVPHDLHVSCCAPCFGGISSSKSVLNCTGNLKLITS